MSESNSNSNPTSNAQAENPFVLSRAEDTSERMKSVSHRADELFIDERFSEAEHLYRKLTEELEGLLGAEHQEVAIALHKLAATLAGQGRVKEAADMESRAGKITAGNEGKSAG